MATAANAEIYFEQGRTQYTYAAMTDSGDNKTFTITGGTIFSSYSGYEADIRPNGIVSGANLVSPHTSNDTVNVAAFSAYLNGAEVDISADTATISRPASNVSKITSIILDNTGAIDVVAGTDGSTTAFSETRGAAGGPPLIPADEIEIAQVRVTAQAAAVVVASEIFQVAGQHSEYAFEPSFTVYPLGEGDSASAAAKKNAHIVFDSALPTIHTGSVAKAVYIQYYAPILAAISRGYGFVPAEKTAAVTSKNFYGGVVNATNLSLGTGSFNVILLDGVRDSIVRNKNQVVTIKAFPDRNKAPYILTQGTISIARVFPEGDQIEATVTIAAEGESVEFTS